MLYGKFMDILIFVLNTQIVSLQMFLLCELHINKYGVQIDIVQFTDPK